MHDELGRGETRRPFEAGLDDVLIYPIAVVGLVVKTLVRWTWSILVHLLDYAFPIFLQVARFVLFTFRIIGDGLSALLRFIIKFLPLPKMRRQAWREAVARAWSWLRRKLSYRAFEEWVHHLFEDGMAWTFRKCRALSPGAALLVILFSIVWIPVSFTAATAVHAWLIAEAATLPKWMQVLHVVAAVLAKSKLLMLPAYPAAWPQAKKHPIVEAGMRVCRFVATLRLVDKTLYRFGQIEAAMERTAGRLGIIRAWSALGKGIAGATTAVGNGVRGAIRPIALWLSKLPVMNSVIRSYAAHYDRAEARPQKLSERVKAFYKRWELKFSPAYYEEREKEKAAEQAAAASAPPVAPPGPTV